MTPTQEPDERVGAAAAPQVQSPAATQAGTRSLWSEAFQVIGGLVAVTAGLIVVLVVAILAVVFVGGSAGQVAAVASSAFGVIGTIVGAYFGVKIGTDQTKQAMNQTNQAVEHLRREASKAQAFAAHLDRGDAT